MRANKALLSVTFSSWAVAILVAVSSPATGFEPSIYGGTPLLVWIALSIAIVAAVGAGVQNQVPQAVTIIALTIIMQTVAFMPVLRGYWLVGAGDPMTHLGYTLDVSQSGTVDLKYPLMFLIVESISGLTDTSHRIVLMGMGTLFIGLFSLSHAILVRYIIRDNKHGLLIGAVLGLSLLPVTRVATHIYPHPDSFAILFAPFFIYVTLRALDGGRKWYAVYPFLVGASILLHPQQSLNILLVVATIAILHGTAQSSVSIRVLDSPPVIAAALFGVAWAAWITAQERFIGATATLIQFLMESSSIDPTAGRGSSLSALDISLLEFAVRLFALDLLIAPLSLVAGLVALGYGVRRLGYPEWVRHIPKGAAAVRNQVVLYLIIGTIPVSILFSAYLVAGVTQQFMRFVGFLMLIASILSAVGIYQISNSIGRRIPGTARTYVVVLLVSITLVGAGATYYNSPSMYRHTGHVTEASIAGYSTAFDYHDGETDIVSVNNIVWRYAVGIEGHNGRPMLDYTGYRGEQIPVHFSNQSLHNYFSENRLLVVNSEDRYRETVMLNGLHYSQEDFNYLNEHPSNRKVYDNNGAVMYEIDATSEADSDE